MRNKKALFLCASFVLGLLCSILAARDNLGNPSFALSVWDFAGVIIDMYWMHFVIGQISERIKWHLLIRQRIREVVGT